MAADDPDEKSLFCRIKDCVLAELNRNKNEVKRAKCPSRSIWVWDLGQSSKPAEATEPPKVDREIPTIRINPIEDKDSKDRNDNKDERLRGGHGNVDKGGEQEKIHLESKEHSQTHSHLVEKDKSEGNQKSTDHSNSCDSKPVRYYIKMQNPEAPPCCETRRPRKICPPKMRKPQEETRSHCPPRPTCRCEGCVAEFNQQHYSMN
ncbi:uncharacterized protein [Venturia canescens]|uniref:uncharacterized protein n=1 Tax=Venturia canescens TaxID=32260 RepID=UPI001C9BC750|nr:uncharacterized protein LOC122414302 [Venturia canescens]